jgi:phosphoribosyl 1,2-cyclic phosphodiesterase
MQAGTAGAMRLRFWGVRGSLPSPGAGTQVYGGNTCCVELRCGPHLLVLDAGSGARALGDALMAAGGAVNADLLFSHTHLDHILGLPFFAPIYQNGTKLRFWGGHLNRGGLEAALDRSWSSPLMPDLRRIFRADLRFEEFRQGSVLQLHPGLKVSTAALRHPGGCTGYRVEWQGKVVAYVTDTEHKPGDLDPNVLQLARDADVLIYDASYGEEEFASRLGWGHSTWQHAARLAEVANVGRLVLFHHEPGRDDMALAKIEQEAAERRPGTLAAREGMLIEV